MENQSISYIAHESAMARAERHIKRLWIALIVAIVMIFASNAIWLAYINQYDFESYEISTDGGGNANYIGNDGDIYNGKDSGQEKNEEER
jgi:biotin transporter BioY